MGNKLEKKNKTLEKLLDENESLRVSTGIGSPRNVRRGLEHAGSLIEGVNSPRVTRTNVPSPLAADSSSTLPSSSSEQEIELLNQRIHRLTTEKKILREEVDDLKREMEETTAAKIKAETERKKYQDELEEIREEAEEEMEEKTSECNRR